MKNGCRLKHCRACLEYQKLETTSLTQQLRKTETSEKPREAILIRKLCTRNMFLNTPPNLAQSKTQCVPRHLMSRNITNRTKPMLASKPPDRFLTMTCILFVTQTPHDTTVSLILWVSTIHVISLLSVTRVTFNSCLDFSIQHLHHNGTVFETQSSRSGMTARVVQKIGSTFRGLSTLQNCGRNRSGRERNSCRQP